MNRTQRVAALMILFLGLLSVSARLTLAAESPGDVVSQARTLARSGKTHRAEALASLSQHLAQSPADTDARVLYGIVLSWEGRYDEAREQLSEVLSSNPSHADALPALINVELWSDHPARAEELAHDALSRNPDDIALLLAEARALRKLNRDRDAIRALDRVLVLEPMNQEARSMRRTISRTASHWQVDLVHSYDWFSDGRDPQHETAVQLHAPTPLGSLIGRVNRADRFSLTSYQTELDFYPHIRTGTYAYLNVGYSADEKLYPRYRVGADLFQSLGHGWEASGGYRRLAFGDGINIYTFALAKYYRSWLFTGRGFVTPGTPGTSRTAVFSARYFLGSEGTHDYVEVRYSRGASPALARTLTEILVLDSSRFSAELDKALGSRWGASFSGGISQEQRIGLTDLKRYTLQGFLYYRF